jgi:hypothetical protein
MRLPTYFDAMYIRAISYGTNWNAKKYQFELRYLALTNYICPPLCDIVDISFPLLHNPSPFLEPISLILLVITRKIWKSVILVLLVFTVLWAWFGPQILHHWNQIPKEQDISSTREQLLWSFDFEWSGSQYLTLALHRLSFP